MKKFEIATIVLLIGWALLMIFHPEKAISLAVFMTTVFYYAINIIIKQAKQ